MSVINESVNIVGFIAALIIPAVLGYGWIRFFWQESHISARLGYGYLLGVMFAALVVYLYGQSGYPFSFPLLMIILILLAFIPFYLVRNRNTKNLNFGRPVEGYERGVWLLILALIGIRYGGLLIEEILRPLYPWDAWMNWAPRAKVWFELKELAPFVHFSVWQKESLEGAYLLANPEAYDYPPLVPLLQFWNALGLNAWRDNWINLSWGLCVLAFGMAFYGQLRMLGLKPLLSIAGTWMLFSLPYLNTHVALAGYADIWLSAFYCAAVMALINWSISGSKGQLLLVILMGLACILSKKPGLVWVATLLPGLVLGWLPSRTRYIMLGAGAAIVIWFVLRGGWSLQLPDGTELIFTSNVLQIPGIGSYSIAYHPVSDAFVKNYLLFGNWNMLGWLLVLLVPISMVRSLLVPKLLPGAITVGVGMVFVFVVFFFTRHFQAALDATTINRASFHLIPAMLYWTIVAFFWKAAGLVKLNAECEQPA